jgi:hypothetical protein
MVTGIQIIEVVGFAMGEESSGQSWLYDTPYPSFSVYS